MGALDPNFLERELWMSLLEQGSSLAPSPETPSPGPLFKSWTGSTVLTIMGSAREFVQGEQRSFRHGV